MPRRQEPKKDGVSSEKPRGAASKHRSVDLRMGKPGSGDALSPVSRIQEGTWGTETSKYPEEEKSNEIPSVAASERGRAQTVGGNSGGVEDQQQSGQV